VFRHSDRVLSFSQSIDSYCSVRTGARHVDPDYANRAGLDRAVYALVSVSDTGAGIAPEIQAHVFEPFFTTKPVGQGTGLGLASVHGIVQGRGGIIELESQPGHGTTFQILLPAAPVATAMPATNHRGRVAKPPRSPSKTNRTCAGSSPEPRRRRL
jgi:signal transduction histidine kinase